MEEGQGRPPGTEARALVEDHGDPEPDRRLL